MECSTYVVDTRGLISDDHTQTVQFYEVAVGERKAKFDYRASALTTHFSDGSHAYNGRLDASV